MKSHMVKGFTIIELVVVIVIIGILAAVALPRFLGLQDRAHDAVVEGAQAALASGVMMANAAWQSYGRDTALDDVVNKAYVFSNYHDAATAQSSVDKCENDGADCDTAGSVNTSGVGLDIGEEGYPTGYSQDGDGDGTTSTANLAKNYVRDASDCREIWEFLLNDASMLVEENTTIDAITNSETLFSANNSGESCVYTYLPDLNPQGNSRTITYNSETGRVTVDNLTDSNYSQGS